MNYPDGSPVRVGDLVWWNGGACVGYVQGIAESPKEHETWGLDSPHIFLSNHHPFDPSIGSGIAYPETCFTGEGIGLLSDEEKGSLEAASLQAIASVTDGLNYSSCSVDAVVRENRQVGWKFTFHKNGTPVAETEIPLGP